MRKRLIIFLIFLFTFFSTNVVNLPPNIVKAGVYQDVQKTLKSDDFANNNAPIKCQRKSLIYEDPYTDHVLEGTVVEKNDNSFLIDTKEGPLSGGYPTNFAILDIKTGNKVKVYYTGVILETYPGQIHTVTKIEIID